MGHFIEKEYTVLTKLHMYLNALLIIQYFLYRLTQSSDTDTRLSRWRMTVIFLTEKS
jgi:hypothetical protein